MAEAVFLQTESNPATRREVALADRKAKKGTLTGRNAPIPRDFWLEDWERQEIIRFFLCSTVTSLPSALPILKTAE
jgi:hypothetical protein